MEFEGRIQKVLPVRSGTGQKGEWKALPFVFEYYENPSDRYPDSVLLETMDHDMMRNIGRFVVRGEDKKAILKDGQCELTTEIKCRCGWSHKVNTFKRKDGTDGMMNNMRPYKLEILNDSTSAEGTATQAPAYQPAQQQAPFPATNNQGGDTDDLPF